MSNLLKDNKEIMKYWDYEKNSQYDINKITVGNSNSFYWICPKCKHSWKTRPSRVINELKGCPNCKKIQNKLKYAQNIGLVCEDENLMKEWDFKKNEAENIFPDRISIKSKEKVNWICANNHIWKSSVYNRKFHNRNCPFCCNQKILKGYNDLETINPELAKEWNYEKNIKKPSEVGSGSGKKYWWKCKFGHEWEASISSRNRLNVGCPKCSQEKSVSFPEKAVFFYFSKENVEILGNYRSPLINNKEIDIFFPKLNIGIEYDGLLFHKNKKRDLDKDIICKNKGITIYHITEKLDTNIYSEKNYFYYNPKKLADLETIINNLLNIILSTNKQYDINIERDKFYIYDLIELSKKEKSLQKMYPAIAQEWNYKKNGNLTPELVDYSSSIKVWWTCPNGHDYESIIYNRIKNHGCPYCSGRKSILGVNDITKNKKIMKLWNYERNKIDPKTLKEYSNIKVWWKCENGHEWKTTVGSIRRGTECPYCTNQKILKGYNDLATFHPEIVKYWDYEKNSKQPSEVGSGSGKNYWWKCPYCNCEWKLSIVNMIKRKYKCLNCKK